MMKRKLFFISLFVGISSALNAQFFGFSEPAKLVGAVNTAAEESIPVFSKDSSMLYFVRTFDDQNMGGAKDQDIWYCIKDENDQYNKCDRLTDLNNKFNNAVLGLAESGTAMYLLNAYDGKKDVEKGMAVSRGSETGWSTPTKMEVPGLNIEGEFYGFHVANNENVMIISYQGSGSLGEEDLYVSTKTGGTWTAPLHMGATINSTGFEISPFLSPSGDTIFFSSNGFGGEGDADIFYSVKQGDWTNWSEPVNLGSKINSPKFDAYFSYSGNQVYWSSNRDAELSDIYTARILTPPVLAASCSSVDISEFQAKDGSIDLTIDGGVAPFTIMWSNGMASEDLMSLAKGDYSVTITDSIGQTAETSCSITEPEPPKDVVIRLPEVRYPLNKWTLLVDETINSNDSLLFVYNLLTEYPGLVLELSSHTDSRGSKRANQKLSENRARACYKYLVEEKGIDMRRIVPIGKGEDQPRTIWKKGDEYLVAKPKEIAGVETIVLTEAYINQFKKTDEELFEFLHQLNRRTEGRVLSKDFDPLTAPAANSAFLKYVKYP